jgi:hypothetical protein
MSFGDICYGLELEYLHSVYLLYTGLSVTQQFFVSRVSSMLKLPLNISQEVQLPEKQLGHQSPQPKANGHWLGQDFHTGLWAHPGRLLQGHSPSER